MKNYKLIVTSAVALLLSISQLLVARVNINNPNGQKIVAPTSEANVLSVCTPAQTQTTLDLNNVRATITSSSDMWWNLINVPRYEIPKGSGAHSLFASSLWIGGLDASNQLRVAAQTYRQTGNDFWPGPLDTLNATVDKSVCDAFDKHFIVNKSEVEDFINGVSTSIPNSILNWPGNGNTALKQAKYLAPFFDKDGNGVYDPSVGDYPKYSTDSKKFGCGERQIFGDRTLWWVFNDKGNVHTETQGNPIGIEIRAQAFAFSTTDEINNMTFYDYEVINRASTALSNTYFGIWVDADLGLFSDDYVGCDVKEGVGYCYNGLPVDGSGALGTYGANPPCVGIDFFRGPKADPTSPTDGKDSYGTSFIDPVTNRIQMAKFVYYNNDFTLQGNPSIAAHYYNYLSGFWKDGLPFTYGGDAYQESGPVCNFMFPGSSDPTGLGTGGAAQAAWSESTVGNPPADRRFLQSAGPFTLQPGAVNNVTMGAVWGRTTQGGNLASIQVMKDADIKAQALFNSCFNITNGPDAPDLTIQELNNTIIIYMTNKPTSNNYKEKYIEKDPYINGLVDTAYSFEGYKIYQIVDSSVTAADLFNPAKARLLYQTDVKNNVKQIVNFTKDNSISAWVPKEMVAGADLGITRSVEVKKDLFATGDAKLINHKQYYYMAVAYGFNKGEQSPDPYNISKGFNLPYLEGRRNIRSYVAIPHNVAPEAGGTEQHSNYGDGVKITRIEGQGGGGRVLELTKESIDAIMQSSSSRVVDITYEKDAGPFDVKVVDPLNVKLGCYQLALSDSSKNARWTLTNTTTNETVASDTTIILSNEQIIPEWGISVRVNYTWDPITPSSTDKGFLSASMTFADPTKPWLTAVADNDDATGSLVSMANWIRSGKTKITDQTSPAFEFNDYDEVPFGSPTNTPPEFIDPQQVFEKVLGGTWAPYKVCAKSSSNLIAYAGPAWDKFNLSNDWTNNLASVDIVLTSDRDKWTRCPVLEMQEEPLLAQLGARKLDLRRAKSVNKNGEADGSPEATMVSDSSMSWFPGYAINLETGERLNMAFGEDSGLPSQNGADMIWNPTSVDYTSGAAVFGGKHYIYIFAHTGDYRWPNNDANLPGGVLGQNPAYDKGATLYQNLKVMNKGTQGSLFKYKGRMFNDAMWVNIPLLAQGRQLLETDVTIKIRMATKLRRGYSAKIGSGTLSASAATILSATPVLDISSTPVNNNWPLYSFCTNDLDAHIGDKDIAKKALDLINVVPNPYYAYSGYESDQLDFKIKFTNLPQKCTIRIYTINGTLVRTLTKDNPRTSETWDLKNQTNTAIASGMYVIHIDAPGIGEKTLKWFGVIRPFDVDGF